MYVAATYVAVMVHAFNPDEQKGGRNRKFPVPSKILTEFQKTHG